MLYVIGYPADIGGANVELFDTVKLWRRHGVDVTLIPTWSAKDDWVARLDAIGAKTLVLNRRHIRQAIFSNTIIHMESVPRGSTFISLGNYHIHECAVALKERGCRLIYMPCATEPSADDFRHGPASPIDTYVFQSVYQAQVWRKWLKGHIRKYRLIRGAFDISEFPFEPRPHLPHMPFFCGRISRPDPKKFSAKLWDAYAPQPTTPVHPVIMGWNGAVEAHCGMPPLNATVLEKRSMSSRAFHADLHAIVHPGGEARENWPRYVLEAMASGVPVITDNLGGIPEMITHELNGFLCHTPSEMGYYTSVLARNEDKRIATAMRARGAVERMSDPDAIWAKWKPILEGC